jgi:hypothetical protein
MSVTKTFISEYNNHEGFIKLVQRSKKFYSTGPYEWDQQARVFVPGMYFQASVM